MSDFKTDSQFAVFNTIIIILCFISFATLLAAGMTDPGIIPRQYDPKPGEQQYP